jgi:tRNA-specific 2-thiouridylase
MKALIAMSGGVDSSVAAALMGDAGFECIGVTLKLFDNEDLAPPGGQGPLPGQSGCCSLGDINDAREVAFRLGMPHYVLNFAGEFKIQVIRRFIETYQSGATPNPCIDCNRYIKFTRLLERARELSFDRIVTGHYARIEKGGSRFLLKKGRDETKDQSYVLYTLTQDQLAHTLFPLGDLTKPRVREIARERGLINARKRDSQDICFAPNGDYAGFIEHYTGQSAPEGTILDGSGAFLGKHRGLIRYTIGQRRGLGLSFPQPLYVAAKSGADNTLTLGPEDALYAKSLSARDLNLIACERLDKPLRVRVKTRYLQREQGAVAEQTGEDAIRIDFDEPQRALTPGQAAVFYDGDTVIGGGTIEAVSSENPTGVWTGAPRLSKIEP